MPCITSATRAEAVEECSGFGINEDSCYYYTPTSGGVTFSFTEYPIAEIRKGDHGYNIPDRRDNHVMYPSVQTTYSTSEGPPGNTCGKQSLVDNCTTNFGRDNYSESAIFLDYTPNELSFDFGYSDTWFAYLYDTSDEAGHVGTACYHLETETRTSTTTTTTTGTDPVTGDPTSTSSSSSSTEGRIRCIPCAAFTCSPAKTTLKYTAEQDLTGDPDCPHPTLFGIGTDSNKLVLSYDQFSTQVPNGVTGFEVSYDGVTYVNAWDGTGDITYESPQNPWQTNEDRHSDFEIYDLNDGATAVDFRVKFRIEPIYDDSGATTVFSGTKWTATEILNNGTGFSVGDVFALTYDHRHPDNTVTTLTLNLRISSVGNIPSQQTVEGADVLRVGDVLNGHTITRAFHTEVGEFPYHVVYLNGNGNNFVKDTQYTSSRDHIITAVAGYGIVDRAILIGLYEFLDKSIQFMTGDVNQDADGAFKGIVLPRAFVKVDDNGSITDVNIDSGAYSFDFQDFLILNDDSDLSGYTAGRNIATSGGSGSGLTVDVITESVLDESGNTVSDTISEVLINTAGINYAVGDVVTIAGGSARVRIGEVTTGGSGLNTMQNPPQLALTAPNDNGTALQRESTADGEPKFEIELTTERLSFEVVTTSDGLADIEPVDAENGGDNVLAVIEPTIAGGMVTAIRIVNPGRGYNSTSRPELVITNFNEDVSEEVNNDAYRSDLVPEFQDILKSLPEGEIAASAEDLQLIEDVYSEVPQTMTIKNQEPVVDIKMDPDRERVNQKSQRKLTHEQTDPLYDTIVPEYDITYLDNVDIDSEYKQVIADDLPRSQKTVNENIASITQEKYPEYRVGDETKVESVQGSFTGLPEASTFTKYIMRQYRPDNAVKTTINVSLSCTPVNLGCSHFSCASPTPNQDGTTPGTPETEGDTTTQTDVTSIYSMSALLGPGCQEWEATGSITIWHDLARAARTVTLAAQEYGNPFAD